jgi:hypothetical protein
MNKQEQKQVRLKAKFYKLVNQAYAVKKEFCDEGGVDTLDFGPCPDGYIKNSEGECVPKNDPIGT